MRSSKNANLFPINARMYKGWRGRGLGGLDANPSKGFFKNFEKSIYSKVLKLSVPVQLSSIFDVSMANANFM